jgi:hypothetical protein
VGAVRIISRFLINPAIVLPFCVLVVPLYSTLPHYREPSSKTTEKQKINPKRGPIVTIRTARARPEPGRSPAGPLGPETFQPAAGPLGPEPGRSPAGPLGSRPPDRSGAGRREGLQPDRSGPGRSPAGRRTARAREGLQPAAGPLGPGKVSSRTAREPIGREPIVGIMRILPARRPARRDNRHKGDP